MCDDEISTPYKQQPLHSSRYTVRAIALLDYRHTPSLKIRRRRDDESWLNHNLLRKKSPVVPKVFYVLFPFLCNRLVVTWMIVPVMLKPSIDLITTGFSRDYKNFLKVTTLDITRYFYF